MRTTHLPAAHRIAMPWKNGGGQTWEIAACPEAASLDGFDWRISMARVDSNGPFSCFPGIMRSLAVVEGMLQLHPPGNPPVVLDPDATPWVFPGDMPLHAEVVAPVVDLNLMYDPGRYRASLARLDAGSTQLETALAFLVAPTPTQLSWVAGHAELQARDALRLDDAAGHRLQWPAGTPVYLIEIAALPA